ncbi:DivIVA domain-containing protein [Deinococcus deserti]|uniref:Putative minicell-associated protein DivIVA n=1 Tax=Deinococcus deserti (strain DSM 17065 / CIP 109153 / LMG 22923 / VCD115) TaxID=546414 RepID=C1D1G2_DEIDV|nr:DivIVA domain-containing protein [Deinococcus deserti]ACO45686.1 putative minicell-associated protein DivIVA [Deinococcus deserti VCD115]
MKLSPLDIRHQDFPSRLGGYDRNSVRAFLAQIADQFEDMLQAEHAQSEHLLNLERQIEEQRQAEDEIRRAVVSAERIGHELRENAVRESDLLIAQATTQRESLLREAEARNVELEAQYGARMAALEGAFRTRFAELETQHHQLVLERERIQAERLASLERTYLERHAELTSRLTAARQEYAHFLSGYRALMASFTELSAHHVLPEGALLPNDALPPSPAPDGPVPSGVLPGELTRMMNAAMLPPGVTDRHHLGTQNRIDSDAAPRLDEPTLGTPAEDTTSDGIRVKSQQFL